MKKSKERLIVPETAQTAELLTEQQLENRNGKKNNCMDISSDKHAKSHMIRFGHGYGKQTLSKILNFFLKAAQNNAIMINHIKAKIDKTQNSKCRLCDERDEAINHLISECSKLNPKRVED